MGRGLGQRAARIAAATATFRRAGTPRSGALAPARSARDVRRFVPIVTNINIDWGKTRRGRASRASRPAPRVELSGLKRSGPAAGTASGNGTPAPTRAG